MSIDIKAFLAKDKQADQAVAPHLRAINLYEPQFKKAGPFTQRVRELVLDCNNPSRHWRAQHTARQAIDLLKTCRLSSLGFVWHVTRISNKIEALVNETYEQANACNYQLRDPALSQNLDLADVTSACDVVKVMMMGKKVYYPLTGHHTENIIETLDDAARFMAGMSDALSHFEKKGGLSTLESQRINELNRNWLFVLRKAFDELPYSPETHFINITRHWLEKLPMPSNIDDRRKLVQLRNSFPKDATVSASVLA